MASVSDILGPRFTINGNAEAPGGWDWNGWEYASAYWTYNGEVSVQTLHVPTLLPNIGIPISDINISQLMRDNYDHAISKVVNTQGNTPIAAILYEYRNDTISPNLIGWYFVAVYAEPSSQGYVIPQKKGCLSCQNEIQQVMNPLGMDVQGQNVQGQQTYGFVIGFAGLILGVLLLITAIAIYDQITGGKIQDAFNKSTEQTMKGVAGILQAPFTGAAWLLIAGGVGIMAIAFMIPRMERATGTKLATRQAIDVARAGTGVGTAVLAPGGRVLSVASKTIEQERKREDQQRKEEEAAKQRRQQQETQRQQRLLTEQQKQERHRQQQQEKREERQRRQQERDEAHRQRLELERLRQAGRQSRSTSPYIRR